MTLVDQNLHMCKIYIRFVPNKIRKNLVSGCIFSYEYQKLDIIQFFFYMNCLNINVL